MRHYTKWNFMEAGEVSPSIENTVQIAECKCYYCGSTTRFPILPDHVDWKAIAEEYKRQLDRSIRITGEMVTDIEAMGVASNPVQEYIQNKWAMLLLEIKKDFGKDMTHEG